MTVRDADLMGRPEVLLDAGAFGGAVAGKVVMVIGAGGSIGSAVAERAAECHPAKLCLVTNTENHLYEIARKIGEHHPKLSRSDVLCDIRERDRLARVVSSEAPDLVIHAAALKHIPLVQKNPTEGVLTNVLGTANVLSACRNARVGRVIFLSTDKAVFPSSVMGATKRVAELYCLSNWKHGVRVARLVNVLGSSGSVAPLFWSQIKAGIRPTVTHPEMTRYFMTHREAADFLLHVAGLADHSPAVYLPKAGAPVKIMDLARRMIASAGSSLEPSTESRMRPGEKLEEKMAYPQEDMRPAAETAHANVLRLEAVPSVSIATVIAAAEAGDEEATLMALKEAVPEFEVGS